jgi:diacyltrehalose acyltransferase
MKRLVAGVLAVGVVGAAGGLGAGVALADPVLRDDTHPPHTANDTTPSPVGDGATAQVVYALGGARAPGIPWYDYTMRAGSQYFPTAKRDLIDYPAGAPFSWMPDFLLPPGPRDNVSIGVAAKDATRSLDTAIRNGSAPAAAVGLSQGTLALDQEQARLANDPKAPPPDKLQFTMIGDPIGHNAFGQSFLTGIFKPGDYIPLIDYTVPPRVDSQYDTNKVVATYDGLADFPDRPDNLLAGANALAASAIVHTPAAFTGPQDVPPQNIRTVVNSKGAKETSYLIPVNHLPLTLPLRYLGFSPGFVDQIDAALQPQIDAGYSRYDNPLNRPVSVDPVHGMDPIGSLDPATRGSIEDAFATVRSFMPPLP